MSRRSEQFANLALVPIEPAPWMRPAPRQHVLQHSLWDCVKPYAWDCLGALALAGSIFLPILLGSAQ